MSSGLSPTPGTRQLLRQARAVAQSQAAGVPSPCISVCRIDPASQLCQGCLRTLDDIACWSRLSDDDKRMVWKRVGEHAASLLQSTEHEERASR